MEIPQEPTTGPQAIYNALSKLNIDRLEQTARDELKTGKKTKRGNAIRILNVVKGLRRNEIEPKDLTISKVPVIPPVFRPFSITGDSFQPGDANELYRDLINYKDVHQQLHDELGEEGARDAAYQLYNATKAVYGYADPVNPKSKQRGVSGFLDHIIGKNGGPKFSVFHRRLLSKTVDSVGRGVITAGPDLNMDEVGVPKDMAWKLYGPYIQRRLVQSGMNPMGALEHVTKRTDFAQKALDRELTERPVMYSRAPAWHKYNVIAGFPKIVDGDNIVVNPYVTTGISGDFDGDTMNIHLPALPESVQEAKDKLLPSKMVYSIKDEDRIVPALKHEQILGLYSAQHRPSKNSHVFNSEAEAVAAIHRGDVSMSDEISFPQPEVVDPLQKVAAVVKEDILPQLLQVKQFSDTKQYHAKHKLLRQLMDANEDDFAISDRKGDILGVAHIPSGFRIHTKAATVPPRILFKMLETEQPEVVD